MSSVWRYLTNRTNVLFNIWLAFGLVSLALFHPFWLIAGTAVVAFIFLLRRYREARSLKNHGYFIRRLGGSYLYEEAANRSTRNLTVPLDAIEPGHWQLFVPSEEDWRRRVPDWAQNRRAEIISRIAADRRPEDVHYPHDWEKT